MAYHIKSEDRGRSDFGWLKSRHSFSFGEYYSLEHRGFESLRVINEDWVEGGRGFAPHPHHDMEILTYVVSGAVKHKDSAGNEGIIGPGEIQLMRAGLGIVHSEMNAHSNEELHLLQIWIHPEQKGLPPAYGQLNFRDKIKNGAWALLASPNGAEGSLEIRQQVSLWAKRFSNLEKGSKDLGEQGASVWVQMVKGSLNIDGKELRVGDGVGLKSLSEINFESHEDAEALFFVFHKK